MGFTAILIMTVLAAEPAKQPTAEELRFFENSVRPVLAEHCDKCHGAKKQWANLRLDSREGLLKGGDSGPAIVPGNSKESLLIQAVKEPDEKLRMPKEGKLTDRQIADLMKWVEMGAPFSPTAFVVGRNRDPNHWAFQPPKDHPLPTVKDSAWPVNGLDTFILAKLQAKDMSPSPSADKRTLIRRLSFDLVGLPPSPEEIQAFLADESPDATARLMDRLLASPAYGEKWGRHWLDVARYADSNGLDENVAHGNAWRYRDYVVTAFNEDRPYDRFLTEQLAGDLLTVENEAERQRNLVATGFLAIGPKVLAEVDQAKMQMDIVDEQIDTVGRALLGLTLGCARCHDHKFDPIQTADYYGLAGVFKSTKTMENYTKVAKWNENPLWDFAPKMPGDTDPATAMGVTEDKIIDVAINIRGNPQKLGEVALRHVPPVVRGPATPQFTPTESGRRELAQWMTDDKNPLTSRVLVNRVWRWHFGQGIVRSTDNFGLLGEKPTHPELLDWLSQRFVNSGWSIKKLHRVMLNSSTWQQDSGLPSGPLWPHQSSPAGSGRASRLAPRRQRSGRFHDGGLAPQNQEPGLFLRPHFQGSHRLHQPPPFALSAGGPEQRLRRLRPPRLPRRRHPQRRPVHHHRPHAGPADAQQRFGHAISLGFGGEVISRTRQRRRPAPESVSRCVRSGEFCSGSGGECGVFAVAGQVAGCLGAGGEGEEAEGMGSVVPYGNCGE